MGSSSVTDERKNKKVNDGDLKENNSLENQETSIINQNHKKGCPESISKNQMKKIMEQMDKSICKIEKKDITGTGFICIIPNPDKYHRIPVLFTCNHVLGNDDIKPGKEIKLIFNEEEKKLKIDNSRKIYTSNENGYDVTIIELKEEDKFNQNDLLEIDNDIYKEDNIENLYKDKSIYIIHYPKGKEVKHSIDSIIKIEKDRLHYKCSTEDGSSGAPILNLDTYNVVGFHLGANKDYDYNIGIIIKTPINKFNELFPSKIKKNEILLTLKVEEEDINKKIYFLDNTDYVDKETNQKHSHYNLKELNEKNVKIYIDEKEYKYSKFFKPKGEGIYKIKIKFDIRMTNCSCMFYNCNNLRSIDLSSFETNYVSNMTCMFSNCNKLREINLSFFNTQNVTNMSAMFSDCNKLKDIDLSSFNTEKVTNMSAMFSNCDKLKDIDLEFFNTKNVINMNAMFADCKSIKDIGLSSFNTENVEDMSSMFLGCESLKKIDLSSFNTEKVKDMSAMFFCCTNLKNINISSFKTKSVKDMNAMFFGCNNLKSIDLSSFSTENVCSMRGMFGNCNKLKIIDLSSFDTKNVVEMQGMLADCHNLTKINLSSFDTKSVKKMAGMFYGCKNLKNIDLSSFDIINVKDIKAIFDNCNNLTKIKTNKNSLEIFKKEIDKKILYI